MWIAKRLNVVCPDEQKKVHGKHCLKNPLTTILSDGVPFHKRFGEPYDDIYCTREVVEVIFVETSGGIEDIYIYAE